ncbi:MAG: alpha amylase, catalytic region [Acidobacteria bacterium]|nr:alpha amylase, catalytic region [Acidobacteriota bacterium]
MIYEINTWVWLQELSQEYKSPVTLARVPREKWDGIADLKVDAVWFMGVWERSPAGIAIANQNKGLLEDFRRALSDFRPEDNVGSPYCVRQYVVDEHLGGRKGLAVARRELAKRGIKLILDFVPNHVAPDHPWVIHHPEYFVQGNTDDARNDPASFVETGGKVFACGRDPYFPAWPDVLQLNAFQPGLRQAVIGTLSDIADQSDGVRCDMAMLFINSIFERTWGNRAGQRPATEYWVDVISAIKKAHPDFLFMAEAYWDLEWDLQLQGFDYCYDKRLYDRLEHDTAESVRLHLCADLAFQGKLVRFIENHDEPRALSVFSPQKERAAAVTMATIPGAKLFHEGQFEGRKIRLPVFLCRRPVEPVDRNLKQFYDRLLSVLRHPVVRNGQWQLLECIPAWEGNWTRDCFVTFGWEGPDGERLLVAVNYAPNQSQCYIRLPFKDLGNGHWRMQDLLGDAQYDRDGNDLQSRGLYLDVPPWHCHAFTMTRLS